IGRLRNGVTLAQAKADLNGTAAYLAKSYPKEDEGMAFRLARPGLAGDMLGGPVHAFVTGLMLLAGLILLAACANLGGLFTARAADRTREVALLLALGSGFLFGMVPVRQVMKTDPFQGIKSGTSGWTNSRRVTLRDLLLGAQIALCAVLVTSSLVAVRGMI